MKQIIFVIAIVFSVLSCATTTQDRITITTHPAYISLPNDDKDVVKNIMDKADDRINRDYYYSKLLLLLNTKSEQPEKIGVLFGAGILQAVEKAKKERELKATALKISVEDYINEEEMYELIKDRKWSKQCPTYFGPCFMIVKENVEDILVNVKVHLSGSMELVEAISSFEDSIEKHLNVSGFNVNLVFAGYVDENTFNVKVDPQHWPTSYNWVGNYTALAHELLHLLGLDDEYDYIENHAGNKYLSVSDRLGLFIRQMDIILPPDSNLGIMSDSDLRILDRQICSVVGLGESCVRVRTEGYGK